MDVPWAWLTSPISLAFQAGCVVGLILLWWRVFRKPSDGPGECGACGYAVRGISTFTCPECGNDLREVGIESSARRGAVRLFTFFTLWTVLLILPAVTLSHLAWKHIVAATLKVTTVTQVCLLEADSFDLVMLTVIFQGQVHRAPDERLLTKQSKVIDLDYDPDLRCMQIRIDGGAMPLELDPSGGQYRMDPYYYSVPSDYFIKLERPAVEVDWPPTAAQLQAWLKTGQQSNMAAADELSRFIEALVVGDRTFSFKHYTLDRDESQVSVTTPTWFRWIGYVAAGFWAAVWLLGSLIYLYVRRRRFVAMRAEPA